MTQMVFPLFVTPLKKKAVGVWGFLSKKNMDQERNCRLCVIYESPHYAQLSKDPHSLISLTLPEKVR